MGESIATCLTRLRAVRGRRRDQPGLYFCVYFIHISAPLLVLLPPSFLNSAAQHPSPHRRYLSLPSPSPSPFPSLPVLARPHTADTHDFRVNFYTGTQPDRPEGTAASHIIKGAGRTEGARNEATRSEGHEASMRSGVRYRADEGQAQGVREVSKAREVAAGCEES